MCVEGARAGSRREGRSYLRPCALQTLGLPALVASPASLGSPLSIPAACGRGRNLPPRQPSHTPRAAGRRPRLLHLSGAPLVSTSGAWLGQCLPPRRPHGCKGHCSMARGVCKPLPIPRAIPLRARRAGRQSRAASGRFCRTSRWSPSPPLPVRHRPPDRPPPRRGRAPPSAPHTVRERPRAIRPVTAPCASTRRSRHSPARGWPKRRAMSAPPPHGRMSSAPCVTRAFRPRRGIVLLPDDRARAQAHQARGPAVPAADVDEQQRVPAVHAGGRDLAPAPAPRSATLPRPARPRRRRRGSFPPLRRGSRRPDSPPRRRGCPQSANSPPSASPTGARRPCPAPSASRPRPRARRPRGCARHRKRG